MSGNIKLKSTGPTSFPPNPLDQLKPLENQPDVDVKRSRRAAWNTSFQSWFHRANNDIAQAVEDIETTVVEP